MNVVDALILCSDDKSFFRREVALFATPEHGIIDLTTNDFAGAVEFDWFKIWYENLKLQKEVGNPASKAIMIHTHPAGADSASATDHNMVVGWRKALGIPIHFIVVPVDSDEKYYICDKIDNEFKTECLGVEEIFEMEDNDYWTYTTCSDILRGISRFDSVSQSDIDEILKQLQLSKLLKLK